VTFFWHLREMSAPGVAIAVMVAQLALAGVCTRAVVALRLTRPASSSLLLANLATIAVGLLVVRPGVSDGYAFWAAGGGAPTIATVSLLRPLREAAAATTVAVALTVGCMIGVLHCSVETTAGPAGILVAACAQGAAHKRAMDRIVSLTEKLVVEDRQVAAVEQISRAEHEVDAFRLGHVRSSVLPFLTEIITGRADATGDIVHRRARGLAQQVRLRLLAPMTFRNDRALARLCDDASLRGVDIDLGEHARSAHGLPEQVSELLRVVLADHSVASISLNADPPAPGGDLTDVTVNGLVRGVGDLHRLGVALRRLGADVDALGESIMFQLRH
jgi:hypothetical protein